MAVKKIRVASYLRVSTEEQKRHGDSLATQRGHIQKYFNENSNAIHVGEYADEGISANKLKKRTELQRLLNDVKNGKIDLIIFTKLDRWFRSVAKYYKIQDVLNENNVSWQAILEDYETLTANGRFKVNIMLAVAEQERDRDSDRIKDVFQYKVSQGQPITGAQPFPFMIKEIDGIKRVVHNPKTEAMTYDWIEHLKTYNSLRGSNVYINEKYDKAFDYTTISNLIKNTMLYGSYRGNDNYCQPYMTKKEFDTLQDALKKNVRFRTTNHIHLFTKMVKCPYCGQNLIGFNSRYISKKTGKTTISYMLRCENRYRPHKKNNPCKFKHSIYEHEIEDYLIQNLNKLIESYISSLDIKEEKKKTVSIDKQKKKLKEEMERLNTMYQKGRITYEKYDTSYEELENKLKTLVPVEPQKDVSRLKKILDTNYIENYKKADKADKKAFWNSIIKEIHVNDKKEITNIIFW